MKAPTHNSLHTGAAQNSLKYNSRGTSKVRQQLAHKKDSRFLDVTTKTTTRMKERGVLGKKFRKEKVHEKHTFSRKHAYNVQRTTRTSTTSPIVPYFCLGVLIWIPWNYYYYY
jgi:hypothetical protein